MESLDQDDVLLCMVCKHDGVFSAAGADGKSAYALGVELYNRLYPNIDFFGLGCGVRWRWSRCFGRRCGLGVLDALS